MKYRRFSSAKCSGLFLLAALILAAAPVWAGTPIQVPVQGLLSDAEGQVVDGPTEVTFKIYADATSTVALWESEVSLAVDRGLFEANLGAATELDSDVFAAHPAAHLSMTIAGDVESSRIRLGTVPTAAHAISADFAENAQTLQGKTPQELAGVSQASLDALIQRVAALEAQQQTLQNQVDGNATEISAVDARVDAVTTTTTTLGNQITAAQTLANSNASSIATLESQVGGFSGAISALQTQVGGFSGAISALQTQVGGFSGAISALQTKTASMTATTINGKNALTFDAVNVYVRSGAGSTAGSINGTGNLVIGYDEARTSGSTKTGSHNLILGRNHNYTSYGGIAAGDQSDISAPYASVLGGTYNKATGMRAVVVSGYSTEASGSGSAIVSGWGNLAIGSYSAVLGGDYNEARAFEASIGGGSYVINELGGYQFMAEGVMLP